MKSRIIFAVLILLSSLSLHGSAQSNLVQNGDFETGDLTSWNVNDPNAIFVYGNSHSGNDAAWLATYPGLATGVLSQDLSTLPGQQYQIDFFLANNYLQDPVLSSPSALIVSFGGTTFVTLNPVPYEDYTEETAIVTATNTTTTLAFNEQQEPGYFYLDDVSVKALSPSTVSAVPEMTGGLDLCILCGLIGLILLCRHKWSEKKSEN